MGIIIEQRQRIDDNDEGYPRGLSFLLKISNHATIERGTPC